ncbi:MAG: heme NO-binding protein [Rhodobacteraceae bacterium]|nr:heme NO-binding protein [Paracoccaceae bacterium]
MFLTSVYGQASWDAVVVSAGMRQGDFEPMLRYAPAHSEAIIKAAAEHLERSAEGLLEDMGTHLVAHRDMESLRRLLRFSGVSYVDFLNSLDELPGRARLALDDDVLPHFVVEEAADGYYYLTFEDGPDWLYPLMIGVLRGMADDYGALVTVEMQTGESSEKRLEILIFDANFSIGKAFDLAS